MFNRLLFVTTVATCLATLVGFLARSWWFFELFSHFRVQYLIVLAVCGLVYVIRRRRREAFLAIGVALVNFFVVGNYQGETRVHASIGSRQEKTFRAVVVNVNYKNQAYNKVKQFIQSADADFVILLEVNEALLWNLKPLFEHYRYNKLRLGMHGGIALFSRIPFEYAGIRTLGGVGLSTVIARFVLGGESLTLMGTHTYSPASRWRAAIRNQQLAELAKFVSNQQGSIILLGDLNTTPWSPYFRDFLRRTGLLDSRKGFGLQPTWPTRFFPVWIPIDHGLVSSNVKVHRREVGPDIGSDHYPVVIDFSITAKQVGQGAKS